jgi:hypothetical protein
MPHCLPVSLSTYGPVTGVVTVLGLVAASAWIAWRFGPTLLRLTGWCSWWAAWACGSQGGFAYCAALVALGTLAWGTGTLWYAKRRGRWPSAISHRLLTRVLGRHGSLPPAEPSDSAVLPLRRR